MISIIIPSYNQQEYLADAIESVLDQNVQGELIIIDDGSTDNSLAIAKKYESEHPDIVRVISQVNKGLASARNTGIMNAKFDWVLPLDADDMLMDGAMEFMIKASYKFGRPYDILAPSLKTFGSSNQEIILMNEPKLEDFQTGNRIGYCAAIRKSVLLAIGGYNPKMIFGYEDLHLTINLLSRGSKIVTIPEPLWLYRTKTESMWTKAKEHHQELLDIINQDFPEAKLKF